MYIAELVISNIRRYRGEFCLDLGPGCYAIVAEDENDSTQSNGLGKSDVTRVIKWILDGKKIDDGLTVTIDDMISHGEDSMRGVMNLSDGTSIRRTKTRDKPYSLVVLSDGKEYKQDDAQEIIWKILGITYDDMSTTCWSEQGDLASIAKAKPTALMELIESWVGDELEKLVEAGDIVNSKLKTAVEFHERAVEEKQRLITLGNDEEVVKAQVNYGNITREYEREKKIFDDELKNRLNYSKGITLSQEIETKDDLLIEIKNLSESVDIEERVPPDDELQRQVSKQASKVNEITSLMNDIGKECKRLNVLMQQKFEGECPVSKGFICPATKSINARGEEHKKAFNEENIKYQSKNSEYKKEYDKLDQLNTIVRQRQNEDQTIARMNGKLEQLKKRLTEVNKRISELKSEGIEPLKEETIPPKLTPPDSFDMKQAEQYLKQCKQAQEALPLAIKRVEETAKEVRAYRLANALLGPEGARRKVIEGVVNKIEYDANKALQEANVGQSVKAVWGRETGSLADQCYECGSAFPSSAKIKRCEKCGSTRGPKIKHEPKWHVGFASGAGFDTAGLGLRIAGYKWNKENRGTTWGVAILDEPTAQMDEFRRRALSACIQKLLSGAFEQAFITSHSKATLESCAHKILITGKGKWSTIEVVQ